MRYRVPAVATILLTLLVSTRLGFAKGTPDKIVISGGGLRHPVEITDSLTRFQFNPWTGRFAEWQQALAVSPSQCGTTPYDVRFYMRWPGRRTKYDLGDLTLIYDLTYCRDARMGAGWIHLPGPGEPLYPVNGATIVRHGQDGQSFPASSEWSARFAELIGFRSQQ